MSFEKQTTVNKIEVTTDHTVVVRYVVTVLEDGKPFADQIKESYFKPGVDYSGEDAKVQAICATVHTAEVIAAYIAAQTRDIQGTS